MYGLNTVWSCVCWVCVGEVKGVIYTSYFSGFELDMALNSFHIVPIGDIENLKSGNNEALNTCNNNDDRKYF